MSSVFSIIEKLFTIYTHDELKIRGDNLLSPLSAPENTLFLKLFVHSCIHSTGITVQKVMSQNKTNQPTASLIDDTFQGFL